MTLSEVRDRLEYQSLLLGTVVLITCAVLAFAYQLTREPIRTALENDLLKNFSQVLPPTLHDNNLLNSQHKIQAPWGEITWYQATMGDQVTAVVLPLTATGYAGDIEMLMSFRDDGRIAGVRVLIHKETPGLGDKIEISRSPWITSFNGTSLDKPGPGGWAVKKDGGAFDQFTGATITPRAVVGAIKGALEFFDARKATFLAPARMAGGNADD